MKSHFIKHSRNIGSVDFSTNNSSSINISCANLANGGLLTPESVTIIFWFYAPVNIAGGNAYLYYFYDNSQVCGVFVSNFGNGLQLDVAGNQPSILTVSPGVWYFYAGVGNGTTFTGYAAPIATTISSASATNVTDTSGWSVWTGNSAFTNNWQGLISGVKIWGRPLSIAELSRERLQLAPYSNAGLSAYLPFHGSPSAPYDAVSGVGWSVGGTPATSYIAPPIPEVVAAKPYWFRTFSASRSGAKDPLFFGCNF